MNRVGEIRHFVSLSKIRYTDTAMENQAGYREIEHTADWELQVWAPDLSTLLQTAARGMYVLSQTEKGEEARVIRRFELSFFDRESLLVDFLSELLFLGEDEGLALDGFDFDFSENTLKVQASGVPIRNQAKEIKAVTFHRLKIRELEQGLKVNIVFDV